MLTLSANAADWKIAGDTITAPWAEKVNPANPLPEYPRPQMVRKDWTNLNGLWDYAIRPKDAPQPDKYDGKILVPYPVESALSGVRKPVTPSDRLWYRQVFKAPDLSKGKRLLLHFGAVDWQATVFVNGKEVGHHQGGYDPFTFDITDAINPDRWDQTLVVSVWDPTDTQVQPRGKQVLQPKGIWYTAVTGIWQTVWLEPVATTYISEIRSTTDVDLGKVTVSITIRGPLDGIEPEMTRELEGGIETVGSLANEPVKDFSFTIQNPKLWSVENPNLYDVKVRLKRNGEPIDEVSTYFAMRKIEVKRSTADGHMRIHLNNKPLFLIGPLDQGWWPDGLYTAPTDDALKYDIEIMKKLGLNMARKHVKVEPDRWYYWCDKLGFLVWQDMPSAMAAPDTRIKRNDPKDATFTKEQAENFRTELHAMVESLRNHPCIIAWVPFNEGWGQHDTNEVLKSVKQLDPTRLVDGPSGWADRGWGDLHDMHHYPTPEMYPAEPTRASVLGEFGGLGLPLPGHTWVIERKWGYRNLTTQAELQKQYEDLITQLPPLIEKGLSAAVYTQTTDVEGEVNGLMTYDRKVIKLDAERVAPMHRKLYEPSK